MSPWNGRSSRSPDHGARGGYTCGLARSGFFVTLEGLDGCGKTTQIGRLAQQLRTRGIDPVVAQEPGGTRTGRSIRSILLHSESTDLRPHSEVLLYFASRVQNLAEVILPALEAGRVVICDRFTDATVAYQGYGRGLGANTIWQLNEILCDGEQPDLTIWLDVEPETSLERARTRDERRQVDEGRMESQAIDFFLRVRQGYLQIHKSDPDRFRRIDASGTENDVAATILETVLAALRQRGLAGQ